MRRQHQKNSQHGSFLGEPPSVSPWFAWLWFHRPIRCVECLPVVSHSASHRLRLEIVMLPLAVETDSESRDSLPAAALPPRRSVSVGVPFWPPLALRRNLNSRQAAAAAGQLLMYKNNLDTWQTAWIAGSPTPPATPGPCARDGADIAFPLLAAVHERDDELRRALTFLAAHYQEVLRLRHEEECTFEEIGQRQGRSAQAARKLWRRALEHLRELLEPAGAVFDSPAFPF